MLLCELLGQNQGSWLAEESMGLARWELGWGQPEPSGPERQTFVRIENQKCGDGEEASRLLHRGWREHLS